MMLLQPGEPAAFTIERAEARSAFVIACDHASNRIPTSLRLLGLSPDQLQSHIAWDLGIADVASDMAELLDATLVRQNYSRLVIDCNRPLVAPDSIAEHSEWVGVRANVGITNDKRLERQQAIFEPYHRALRETLDRRLQTRPPVERTLLVSMHSFTPTYHGLPRPWHVGVLCHRDRRLGEQLLAALRQDAQLRVGDNEPYAMEDASDYTLVEHGERRGIPHVGIEVRQDLIADEAGQRSWARRLATCLQAIRIH